MKACQKEVINNNPGRSAKLSSLCEKSENVFEESTQDSFVKTISPLSTSLPSCIEVSPLKGFDDTPDMKYVPKMVGKFPDCSQDPNIFPTSSEALRHSSNPTAVSLYDLLSEENSNNAVDIKISDIKFMKTKKGGENMMKINASFMNCSAQEKPQSNIYRYEKSPDIFCTDDSDKQTIIEDKTPAFERLQRETNYNLNHINSARDTQETIGMNRLFNNIDSNIINCQSFIDHALFQENCRREEEVLLRIKKSLEGLPPPPSVTIPQIDMCNTVLQHREQILNYLRDVQSLKLDRENQPESETINSLFRPTHSLDETKEMGWRGVLSLRQHGIRFNLCTASENNEYLALSVIDRFVGCETTSSYRNSPSSAKKRITRMKLITQSPGNRLSHLARRRATFSSAHLATNSQKAKGLLGHQILLDKKKMKHRRKGTPKRRTPSSKRKSRTTTSARKNFIHCGLLKSDSLREASKRALFQSPPKEEQRSVQMSNIKPELAHRIEKSKRALFSTETSNSDEALPTCDEIKAWNNISDLNTSSILKRKRDFQEDNYFAECNKLLHGGAENLTPRGLKIKSQSFCIGTERSPVLNLHDLKKINSKEQGSKCMTMRNSGIMDSSQLNCSSVMPGAKIQRAHSEMVPQSNSLTENQRKKLLWAVSQALKEKKISTNHENFKQYAATLARTVRRLFQEYFQKTSNSNSETMLRLAKRYVHKAITGNSADEIYLEAKTQIEAEKSNSRLSGYIAPEEFRKRMNINQQTESTLLKHYGKEFAKVNVSSIFTGAPQTQSKAPECTSQEIADANSHQQKLSIQPNAALQNSSSKNNISGFALRENIIFESERRSGQKNFTGKDQRNMSPYATITKHSAPFSKKLIQNFSESNLVSDVKKVKRQISFDN